MHTTRSSNHFMITTYNRILQEAKRRQAKLKQIVSFGHCSSNCNCCCCLMYMQQTVATHFSVSRMKTWINGSHGWVHFWARQRCRCVNSSSSSCLT